MAPARTPQRTQTEDEFHDLQDKILLDKAGKTYTRFRKGTENSDSDIGSNDGLPDQEEIFALDESEEYEEDDVEEDDDDEVEDKVTSTAQGRRNSRKVAPLDRAQAHDEDDDEDLEFLRKLQANLGANKILEDEFGDLSSADDEEVDEFGNATKSKTKRDQDNKKKKSKKDDDELNSDVEDGAWGGKRSTYYNADVLSDDESADRRKDEEKEAMRLQRERTLALSKSDFMGDMFDDSFMSAMNKKAKKIASAAGKDGDDEDEDEDEQDLIEKIDKKNSRFDFSSEDEADEVLTSKSTVVNSASDDDALVEGEVEQDPIEIELPDVVMFAEEAKEMWQEIKEIYGPSLNWDFGTFSDVYTQPQETEEEDSEAAAAAEDIDLSGKSYMSLKARLKMAYIYNIFFYLSLRANPPRTLVPNVEDPQAVFKALQTHPCVGHLMRLRDSIEDLERVVEGKLPDDEMMDMDMDMEAEGLANEEDEMLARGEYEIEGSDNDEDARYSEEDDSELEGEDEDENMLETANNSDDDDIDYEGINDEDGEGSQANEQVNLDKAYKGIDFIVQEMNHLIQTKGQSEPVSEEDESEIEESVIEHTAPVESALKKKRKIQKEIEQEDDEEDLESALEFYKEIESKTKKAKSDKNERKIKEKEIALRMLQEERGMYKDEHDINKRIEDAHIEGGDLSKAVKRPANWKILANKGLTPYRPKENRNPRVKKRKRYEKAQKKLSSFKRIAKDRSTGGDYQGEATGIKTNLARSVKFV